MRNKKSDRKGRLLLSICLFIQPFPFLFNEYFRMNDFCNGFLRGFGLMLIVAAIIKIRNEPRQVKQCKS